MTPPERPADARRRVAIRDANEPPAHAPFDCSISVLDPWVTPRSTATLAATIENVGDDADSFEPAFYEGSSRDHCGVPGIVLYSTRAADCPPDDYAPPCFDDGPPADAYDRPDPSRGRVGFTLEMPASPSLEPGESCTETILIVDDPTADGCVPPGEYAFNEVHGIEPLPEERRYGVDELRERDEAFVWDWTLVVESVGSDADAPA